MTATIAYDKPVKNLIDELSATGHVTHKSYKKTSVTFHHNGGRLTHEGVLNVWKTRPASAHFDVDAQGDLAQYVKVLEYAWAVANTEGNMRTISIEMCNLTLSPHWEVADVTWQEAARLAGWLFAHVIKEAPTKDNVFFHHHWYSTSCAGPFMDSIYGRLLKATQLAYEHFVGQVDPTPAPAHGDKVKALQRALEVDDDGKWGPATDHRALLMRNTARNPNGRPADVRTAQQIVDTNADGWWGPKSRAALTNWVRVVQRILGVRDDGMWGPVTDQAFLQLRHDHLNNY